ncbi:MAG: flavodoxin domain-containing protein [Candidatus Bathyarchaeia archaeon]
MSKILVIYDSLTGNTAKMAELIAEGAKTVREVHVEVCSVDAVNVKELNEAEAVAIGCPTHAFSASNKIKEFLSRNDVKEALMSKDVAIFTSCLLHPSALKWFEKNLRMLNVRIVGKAYARGKPKGNKVQELLSLGRLLADKIKR